MSGNDGGICSIVANQDVELQYSLPIAEHIWNLRCRPRPQLTVPSRITRSCERLRTEAGEGRGGTSGLLNPV